jgi:DNA-binding response OmpR family regulator
VETSSQLQLAVEPRIEKPDPVARLETRLSALERVQASIMEHIVRLRGVLGARSSPLSSVPPKSFSDALERIEELEMRLEDALAPPEPLPPGLERRLSPIEGKLYGLLKRKACEDARGFVRRDAIMTVLYGLNDDIPSTAGLHVHICHLRRKLPSNENIETVRGKGWRLIVGEAATR